MTHSFPTRRSSDLFEIDFSEVPSNEKLTEFRVHPWGAGVILIAEGALSRKAEKLTAERQSEQERQQLQSELIHISRVSAMGTMASTLAHELNQPLTAIINCLAGCERALDQKQDRKSTRLNSSH